MRGVEWWRVSLFPCIAWASGIGVVAGDGVFVEDQMFSSSPVLFSCVHERWCMWLQWMVVPSLVVFGLLVIVAPLGVSIFVCVAGAVAGVT